MKTHVQPRRTQRQPAAHAVNNTAAPMQASFTKGVIQRKATVNGHPNNVNSDGDWKVENVFIESTRPAWKTAVKDKLQERQTSADPGDEQVIRHIVPWDRLKQSVHSLVRGGNKTYTYLENQLNIHWPETSVVDNPGKKGHKNQRTTTWMNSYLTKYMDAVNNDPANLFYGDKAENSLRGNKVDNPFKAAWGPHNKGLLKETNENNFAFDETERANVLDEFFEKLNETGNIVLRLQNWGMLHTGLTGGQIVTLKKKVTRQPFINYMKPKARWQKIKSLPGVLNRFPINTIPNLSKNARHAKLSLQGKFLPGALKAQVKGTPTAGIAATPTTPIHALPMQQARAVVQRKSTVNGHPNGVNSQGNWRIDDVFIESTRPPFLLATINKLNERQNDGNPGNKQVIRHIMPWADIKMSVMNFVNNQNKTYFQLETMIDNHWPTTSVVPNPGKPSTNFDLTTHKISAYLTDYLSARNNDPANLFYGNRKENKSLNDWTDNPFKAAWIDHTKGVNSGTGGSAAFSEQERVNVLKEFFAKFDALNPADDIENWATRDTSLSNPEKNTVKTKTTANTFSNYMKKFSRWKKITRLPGVLNRVSIDRYEDLSAPRSDEYGLG